MAHLFESGFFARKPAWHGLGVVLPEAVTSNDAIRLANLDWTVRHEPIYLGGSEDAIPDYYANVRSSDRSVLGITTYRYKIVQNSEAFEFVDNLVMTKDVKYESAGSLKNGKVVWLLAQISETQKILDDITQPYILFVNTHDGTASVKALLTTVRVVCNNTLTLALKDAKTTYRICHTGNLKYKIEEAQKVLGLNRAYHEALRKKAEEWNKIKISYFDFEKYVKTILPIEDDASNIVKKRVDEKREALTYIYNNAPDIADHKGTGWGVYNALTDWYEHFSSNNKTLKSKERHLLNVLNPNNFVQESMEVLEDMFAA